MKEILGKYKSALNFLLFLIIISMVVLVIPMDIGILALRPVSDADVLLLDPGHGGIDSGAEGGAGVYEKDINLYISTAVKQMAELDGWTVIMTREDDNSPYKRQDKQSIRSTKTQDLLARKKIIEDNKPMMAVSIHLNSFKQDKRVRGAQTFYPRQGDEYIRGESKRLAETIQKNLVEGLADGTDRVSLSKDDVLLFKNPVVPIVIVECGFLSNPEEESLLNQIEYQHKIAGYIYQGIMEYAGRSGKPPLPIVDNRG